MYFTEGCTDLLQEAGPRVGSVPEFLRKPIPTCDFPIGVWTHCSPSRSAHEDNELTTAESSSFNGEQLYPPGVGSG